MLPTPPFNPTPAQQSALLEALAQGSDLPSIAAALSTSTESLGHFIASGTFADRITNLATSNALALRFTASFQLSTALRLFTTIAHALTHQINTIKVDYNDPASLDQSRRRLDAGRLVAASIVRLARFNHTPPRSTPAQPTPNAHRNDDPTDNPTPHSAPTQMRAAHAPIATPRFAPRFTAPPTPTPAAAPAPAAMPAVFPVLSPAPESPVAIQPEPAHEQPTSESHAAAHHAASPAEDANNAADNAELPQLTEALLADLHALAADFDPSNPETYLAQLEAFTSLLEDALPEPAS